MPKELSDKVGDAIVYAVTVLTVSAFIGGVCFYAEDLRQNPYKVTTTGDPSGRRILFIGPARDWLIVDLHQAVHWVRLKYPNQPVISVGWLGERGKELEVELGAPTSQAKP